MSISSIGIAAAILLAMPVASAGQSTISAQDAMSVVTVNAESGQVTNFVLSESDNRRLAHYSGQTLTAIFALNDPANDQGVAIDSLRQKAKRLIDAGQRSGISTEQTANYFSAYVAEYEGGQIPNFLQGASGQLDARQLFRSVEFFYRDAAPKTVDIAALEAQDLEAIKAVAVSNAAQGAEPVNLQLSVTTPVAAVVEQPRGPEISADADETTRAVLERVRLSGENWVIEIRSGDSLAQFAYALFQDRLRFREIYDLNQGILESPNHLKVGQVLVLPRGN